MRDRWDADRRHRRDIWLFLVLLAIGLLISELTWHNRLTRAVEEVRWQQRPVTVVVHQGDGQAERWSPTLHELESLEEEGGGDE